jgi:hypothetical protein
MQAVIFLTHIETEPIYQHFSRIKAETRGLLDVYLAVHDCIGKVSRPSFPADFRVPADGVWQDKFSIRHAEKKARGGTFIPGFPDLIYMPIMLSPELSGYSSIWFLEYDVDFAGPWDAFFGPLVSSQADLIGTTLYRKDQCPGWPFWNGLVTPAKIGSENYIRAFLPIARFSRRMLDCYSKAIQSGNWGGHSEALYPTLARHHSLTIEDLGGHGPFTPTALLGKNYSNLHSPKDGSLEVGTLIYRPVEHTSYFFAAPERFPQRGHLYHPVKVNLETRRPSLLARLIERGRELNVLCLHSKLEHRVYAMPR